MKKKDLAFLIAPAALVPAALIAQPVMADTEVGLTGQFKADHIDISLAGFELPTKEEELWYAVWTARDGQDDLEWYAADENFNASVAIKNHGNENDLFYIDAYTYVGDDISLYVGGTCITPSAYIGTEEVPKVPAGGQEKEEAGEIDVMAHAIGSTGNLFELQLSGFSVPEKSTVQVAVWSAANGQDDLEWYPMSRYNGKYVATVNVKDHTGPGTYVVHFYCNGAGSSTFIGETSFIAREIPAEPREVSLSFLNKDDEKGSCDIVVADVPENPDLSGIRAAVWSKADQSDIYWYKLNQQENGDWTVRMSLDRHNNNYGKYTCHIYYDYKNGESNSVLPGTVEFSKTEKIVEPEVPVSENEVKISRKSGGYTVRAESTEKNVKSISFAVWSAAGGQDDIRWIDKAADSKGTAVLEITDRELPENGEYVIHAYAKLSDGSTVFVNSMEFIPDYTDSFISASVETGENGTFEVYASGLDKAYSVKEAYCAVWSRQDMSDIIWYDAVKTGSGYGFSSDISKHGNNTGKYNCHVYVGTTDGRDICVCGTEFFINDEPEAEFSDVSLGSRDFKITGGSNGSDYKVTLSGVNYAFSHVRIAVWSEEHGQDDLIWYTADKAGSQYSIDLDISNHKSSGRYFMHAYGVTAAGDYVFIKDNSDLVVELSADGRLSASNSDSAHGIFTVNVVPTASSLPVAGVKVYVKGNDDIWGEYEGFKQGDGTFNAYINIANHGNYEGRYDIEAYAVLSNGLETRMCSGTHYFNGHASVIITGDEGTNKRRISVGGINADSVQAAVWTVCDGQDDLVWYDGVRDSNGSFYFDISGRNHAGDGNYIAHIYVDNCAAAEVRFTMVSYVEEAIRIANDDSVGYSQYRRSMNPDVDCSSFVYYSLVNSGYLSGNSPFDTSYMVNVLTSIGFSAMDYASMEELQKGDILWYRRSDGGHTEIYIGDGKMVGAHDSDDWMEGGDQTGREVSVSDFHNPGWMKVLRKLKL